MLKELLKNPAALFYAILVHAILIAILVVSIQWNSKPAPLQGSEKIVQAAVIDESALQAEKQRKLDEAEAKRKAAAEQQRQAELEKRQAVEAQRQKQQEAERQRQAKLKAEQQAKQQKRLADQKRQAALDAKRQADLAAKRQAEAQRKAAEAKRKADEQRKADEARRQKENLEMMQQQIAQEEADRQAQAVAYKRQQELNSLQAQYNALLKQLVTRNWIRPPDARTGMTCVVRVRLIPSGEVLDAHTVRSSGNIAFDDSAEKAVLRSSPWPKPPDAALFHREVDFVFKPEG